MKTKKYLFGLALTSVFAVYSCGNGSESVKEEITEEEVVEEVVELSCQIKSYSFSLGEMSRTMNFSFDESGKVNSVETVDAGKEESQVMNYAYDENGKLSSFELDKSKATYLYNESGQLTEIKGEGNISTRTFEYDDQGRINKQVTLFGRKPYTTHLYTRTEDGALSGLTILDNKGEETEAYVLTFDDKKNPFVNLGAFANSGEMMLGYAVGNYEHNLVKTEKTYKKKTSYMIDGEYKNAGDTEINELKLAYNESGYPTEVIRTRGDDEIATKIEYDCK